MLTDRLSNACFLILLQFVEKFFSESRERAGFDRLPHRAHRVKEERQVVMGDQGHRRHLAGLIEMTEIRE